MELDVYIILVIQLLEVHLLVLDIHQQVVALEDLVLLRLRLQVVLVEEINHQLLTEDQVLLVQVIHLP